MTAWRDADYLANPQTVTPFDAAQVNPASYDLRLSGMLRRTHPMWALLPAFYQRFMTDGYVKALPEDVTAVLSVQDLQRFAMGGLEALPRWGDVETFERAYIMPGEFILCSSLETVRVPDDCVAMLFSKSSTGRIGLEHLHAGLGDPGFVGTWTWELHNVAPWPIELVAGQRLMQHVFIRLDAAPFMTYAQTGRYQGQQEPTPEKAAR